MHKRSVLGGLRAYAGRHHIAFLALFFSLTGTAMATHELITSADIVDGEVRTPDIRGSAVATAKLRDLAVTNPKLADGAVGTSKLADGAVNGTKVLDDSLTGSDIVESQLGKVGSAADADALGGKPPSRYLSPAFGGYRDGPFDIWFIDGKEPTTAETIVQREMPAGSYLIIAKARFFNQGELGNDAKCRLDAGTDYDRASVGVGGSGWATVVATVLHSSSERFTATLACTVDLPTIVKGDFAKIHAVKVSSISNLSN